MANGGEDLRVLDQSCGAESGLWRAKRTRTDAQESASRSTLPNGA